LPGPQGPDDKPLAPLCSGLARRPLKAVARVRIPSGLPETSASHHPVGGARAFGPDAPGFRNFSSAPEPRVSGASPAPRVWVLSLGQRPTPCATGGAVRAVRCLRCVWCVWCGVHPPARHGVRRTPHGVRRTADDRRGGEAASEGAPAVACPSGVVGGGLVVGLNKNWWVGTRYCLSPPTSPCSDPHQVPLRAPPAEEHAARVGHHRPGGTAEGGTAVRRYDERRQFGWLAGSPAVCVGVVMLRAGARHRICWVSQPKCWVSQPSAGFHTLVKGVEPPISLADPANAGGGEEAQTRETAASEGETGSRDRPLTCVTTRARATITHTSSRSAG
jgi:hypothetical protein